MSVVLRGSHVDSGSVVEHGSAESEGLRLDSSWGLRIFLSHARGETKNIFFYFAFLSHRTNRLCYMQEHQCHTRLRVVSHFFVLATF